jgi:hypothetical protein
MSLRSAEWATRVGVLCSNRFRRPAARAAADLLGHVPAACGRCPYARGDLRPASLRMPRAGADCGARSRPTPRPAVSRRRCCRPESDEALFGVAQDARAIAGPIDDDALATTARHAEETARAAANGGDHEAGRSAADCLYSHRHRHRLHRRRGARSAQGLRRCPLISASPSWEARRHREPPGRAVCGLPIFEWLSRLPVAVEVVPARPPCAGAVAAGSLLGCADARRVRERVVSGRDPLPSRQRPETHRGPSRQPRSDERAR